jgi:transposase
MLCRHAITDEQWVLIEGLLPTRGRRAKNRLFVDAVFWIAKTGAPWRDLPLRFGSWNSVFRRFSRWSKSGVWARVSQALGGEPDLDKLILDTTIVRAHVHAAGAKKIARASRRNKHWGDREVASVASCMSLSMHVASPWN